MQVGSGRQMSHTCCVRAAGNRECRGGSSSGGKTCAPPAVPALNRIPTAATQDYPLFLPLGEKREVLRGKDDFACRVWLAPCCALWALNCR